MTKAKHRKEKPKVETPKPVSLFALMNKGEAYFQRDIRRLLKRFFSCTDRQADDCFFAAITEEVIVQEERPDDLKVYKVKR